MIEQSSALTMVKIYKYFLRTQNRRIEKYNLTQQQLVFLLIILESKEGVGLTDITRMLEIDKSNITRTIQELEKRGFVEKESTGKKVRKYILKLTEEGNRVAAEIKQDESEGMAKMLADFTDEERSILNKIIDKLTNQ